MSNSGKHSARKPVAGRRARKIAAATLGMVLAGGSAFAAAQFWIVGLNGNSAGAAQSATLSSLTISAVAAPTPGNLLYPGANGDVVVKITNPNAFPVTITSVQLPTSTTYAAGYSDNLLTTAVSGCAAGTPSYVSWRYATASAGSSHLLASPITVGANTSNFTVTFTNDATMTTAAPALCEGAYFSLPSLTGVTATADNATATVSGGTNGWTS